MLYFSKESLNAIRQIIWINKTIKEFVEQPSINIDIALRFFIELTYPTIAEFMSAIYKP